MKVLIAYDGSDEAKRAIESLGGAGMPEQAEALVVAPAQVWPPLPMECFQVDVHPGSRLTRMAHALGSMAVLEARDVAAEGSRLLASVFPGWAIAIEVCPNLSSVALLEKAEKWGADHLLATGRFGLPQGAHSRWRDLREGRAAGVLLDRTDAALGAMLLWLGWEGYEALVLSRAAEVMAATA